MTIYQITLRDRETQTVVGYFNGAWTTDRRRALAFRRREAAEAHAARMRDRCSSPGIAPWHGASPTTARSGWPPSAVYRSTSCVLVICGTERF